jgi:hypothetical protein
MADVAFQYPKRSVDPAIPSPAFGREAAEASF